MLKRIGLVAVATIGLSLVATPAFAQEIDTADMPGLVALGTEPTFGDAYNTFIIGGGALGFGAAAVIAGAYTGIATTPALIAHSFSCGGGC